MDSKMNYFMDELIAVEILALYTLILYDRVLK